jgi:hypothetical protein
VLTDIAGVKVHCAENETQTVGGLSNYKEIDGKEHEEQHQSPLKGNRCINSNMSNIYCSLRPRHN